MKKKKKFYSIFVTCGLGVCILIVLQSLNNFNEPINQITTKLTNPVQVNAAPNEKKWKSLTEPISENVESLRKQHEALLADHQTFVDQQQQKRMEDSQRKKEREAYWENRKEWMNQFPFEAKHHPNLKFDAALYSLNVMDIDMDDDDTLIKFFNMKQLVENHGFLKHFYSNPNRYSPEFEQMHDILIEEGLEPDPFVWGWTFTQLTGFHKTATKDLDEPWPINPDKTWRDEHLSYQRAISNEISWYEGSGKNPKSTTTPEHARIIQERLVTEIDPDGFLKVGPFEDFAFHAGYEEALKDGDSLLIR